MLYVFPFQIPAHHVMPIQQIKTHSIFKERLIRFWICQSAWKFIRNSVTKRTRKSITYTRMCWVFHSNFNLQRVHFWGGNKSIYHWHIAKTQHTQPCVCVVITKLKINSNISTFAHTSYWNVVSSYREYALRFAYCTPQPQYSFLPTIYQQQVGKTGSRCLSRAKMCTT